MICSYCRKNGHHISRCHQLVVKNEAIRLEAKRIENEKKAIKAAEKKAADLAEREIRNAPLRKAESDRQKAIDFPTLCSITTNISTIKKNVPIKKSNTLDSIMKAGGVSKKVIICDTEDIKIIISEPTDEDNIKTMHSDIIYWKMINSGMNPHIVGRMVGMFFEASTVDELKILSEDDFALSDRVNDANIVLFEEEQINLSSVTGVSAVSADSW